MFKKPIHGGEATFREPADFRGRDRLTIEAAAFAAPMDKGARPKNPKESDEEYAKVIEQWVKDFVPLTFAENMAILKVKEAFMFVRLASWTLTEEDGSPRPLPTLDTIGDLEIDLYNSLEEASGVGAMDMGVDFSSSGDPEVDEERPTDGSDDSVGPLKAEPAIDDMPRPTPSAPGSTPKPPLDPTPSTIASSSTLG
jgi:hypothetical protein